MLWRPATPESPQPHQAGQGTSASQSREGQTAVDTSRVKGDQTNLISAPGESTATPALRHSLLRGSLSGPASPANAPAPLSERGDRATRPPAQTHAYAMSLGHPSISLRFGQGRAGLGRTCHQHGQGRRSTTTIMSLRRTVHCISFPAQVRPRGVDQITSLLSPQIQTVLDVSCGIVKLYTLRVRQLEVKCNQCLRNRGQL